MAIRRSNLLRELLDLIQQQHRWPLGVDVGWSHQKRSMAVASTVDVFTPFNVRPVVVSADTASPIFAWEGKFKNVCEWVSGLPEKLRSLVVVAVDGPIGPEGRPAILRYVDGACQSGQCHRRCPPASVTGGGQMLVQRTYEFIDKLCGGLQVQQLFKHGTPSPRRKAVEA
ncbi:MAG TPA: hypothetical protein VMC85_12830 [Desulfomonilaceae bacterium]|nr:hypothetical protein [Desulfomonilaceae bacterium]